ncbi:hypothetical protein C8Q70DRAFT_80933 [Cubamyces menziesii]|uniref:Sodium/calcium exchanger membrane region domain-containing protein n=1 Tax=Trametes cubensis TaxID=1111947 RepID=A0AAD7XFI5_9APHY|nr:hypothetical protein C8Q70DRAFT_80933 [Cubamyces menziesii]KAJ8497076.1 hypothetical protein ONZ51_g724 [Trametes cubensis]
MAQHHVSPDIERGTSETQDEFQPLVPPLNGNPKSAVSTPTATKNAHEAQARLKYLKWGDWRKCITLILEPWGLSIFLICIPFAWVSHWKVESWGHEVQFSLCFLSIMALQNIFETCGDQLAWRTGEDIGEFICITFKNCVEATLALILLRRCHLRLLQSTIVGVVVLHLLLVQGTTFFIGGTRTVKQTLGDHQVAINPSLLMVGVLSVVLPTTLFAALDRGDSVTVAASLPIPLVGDVVRGWILKTSHAVSIMLLIIYAISRVHRWRPPPSNAPPVESSHSSRRIHTAAATTGTPSRSTDTRSGTADTRTSDVPATPPAARIPLAQHPTALEEENESQGEHESRGENGPQGENEPREESNSVVENSPKEKIVKVIPLTMCLTILIASVTVTCGTAEFLVESIDPVQERYHIQTEFFGLILLPLVSFLPEAMVALFKFPSKIIVVFFGFLPTEMRSVLRSDRLKFLVKEILPLIIPKFTGKVVRMVFDYAWELQEKLQKMAPEPQARGTPIDSSIQFLLWWMPVVILVGWCTGKPIHLLFDFFEVVLLLGTCFLVNHVTADGETNFAEGFTMFTFYAMIATTAWFYPGQSEVGYMLSCPGSVAAAVASGVQNALVL